MLNTFWYKLRTRPAVRRLRTARYRLGEHAETMGFLAVLALPIAVLTGIVYFAYTNRARAAPVAEVKRIDPAVQRARDLRCLAENIYFEARGEPLEGQYAVAEVTLNRLASKYFPDTICEVVYDRRFDADVGRYVAHFSWTEMPDRVEPSGPEWRLAMAIATATYDDANVPVVPRALFYHANTVHPYWADSMDVVATVGNHIFYR